MAIRNLAAAFILFLLFGCAAPLSRTNPFAAVRSLDLKRVLILPPKVDVFEIGAGGVKEKIDEWSQKASENVAAGLIAHLYGRSILQVTNFPTTGLAVGLTTALTETDLLYDAINRSLLLHSYGLAAHQFDDHRFELSLGKEVAQLKVSEADAFLLVRGSDEISSAGRKALQGATMLAAAAMGVIVIPQPGLTALSLALVDANDGTILWHSLHRGGGGTDLRQAESAAKMVRDALRDFPIK